MNKELNSLATRLRVGELYRNGTRNEDDNIRHQFESDMGIRGTRAWAITQALAAGRGVSLNDDVVDEIIRILSV